MRRRVQLLRHAKSSWDTQLPDHDRPLAPRGHQAAATLRRHLAETDGSPDLVLCSTAKRAVQTWEGVAPAYPDGARVEPTDAIYGASALDLMRILQGLPDTVQSVLLVGHNPGLGDLAIGLGGSGHAELRERLVAKFPTGALATLDVDSSWPDLDWGAAELAGFIVPRQLQQ